MSNIKVISLPERFDFYYHKKFTSDYQDILTLPEVNHIILDFSRVLYLDSSALGMMVLLHRKAQELHISTSVKGHMDRYEWNPRHRQYAEKYTS